MVDGVDDIGWRSVCMVPSSMCSTGGHSSVPLVSIWCGWNAKGWQSVCMVAYAASGMCSTGRHPIVSPLSNSYSLKKHIGYHAIPCPMVTKCPMCNRQTHLSLFSAIPIHPKSHWKQAGDSRLILNKRTKKTEAGDPSPPSRLRLLFFIHSTTYLEFLLLQLLEILETLDSCKKFHSYWINPLLYLSLP